MPMAQPAPQGAQCAAHPDRAARFACSRCGNFMCDECSLGGSETQCPACRAKTGGDFPLSRNDYDFGRVWDYAFEAWKREWVMLSVCAVLLMMVGMVGGVIASIFQNIGMAASGVKQPAPGSQPDLSSLVPLLGWAVFGQIIGTVINVVVQGVVQMGLLRICIDVLHGQKANLEKLFSQLKRLPDYIVSQLIVFAVVGIPSIVLLLVPVGIILLLAGATSYDAFKHLEPERLFTPITAGIGVLSFFTWFVFLVYVSLPLQFVAPEIVYGGASGVEAVKRAWALGNGVRLSIFAVGFVAGLVAFVGLLACCVGILPAMGLAQLLSLTLFLAVRKGSGLPPPVEG